MSRWSAVSDLDYRDEIEGRRPSHVTVSCLRCQRPMDVEVDDPGPYRCEHCASLHTDWIAPADRAVS